VAAPFRNAVPFWRRGSISRCGKRAVEDSAVSGTDRQVGGRRQRRIENLFFFGLAPSESPARGQPVPLIVPGPGAHRSGAQHWMPGRKHIRTGETCLRIEERSQTPACKHLPRGIPRGVGRQLSGLYPRSSVLTALEPVIRGMPGWSGQCRQCQAVRTVSFRTASCQSEQRLRNDRYGGEKNHLRRRRSCGRPASRSAVSSEHHNGRLG